MFLNIDYSLNGYAIIDVSWYSEIKVFTISTHASSVPNFSKGSLSVFLVEEVSINEDVIITVFIEIVRMNSKSKIDVIIFIIIAFWFISCDDHWIPILDIFFYPLKKVFVLRLRIFVVPGFIGVGKFLESLLGILTD